MSMDTKTMPAGQFKQQCLAVLDDVDAQGVEVIITKRGRPVARIVPITRPEDREAAILAKLRGCARLLVDDEAFLQPIDDAGWELLPEAGPK
ncbi:MAG: hypothetical protein AMXMBFR64_33830 [Myxococcales bacterium]